MSNGPNYEDCPIEIKPNDEKLNSKNYEFINNEPLESPSCDKTAFGCCDDGFTIAKSLAKENCPDYVIDLNEPANKSEYKVNNAYICWHIKI
jgi:hypothetical protein